MGLAYPSLAEDGIPPVFDSMMDQHLLKNNMFAFYLTMDSSQVDSDLTFGYYDKTKFKGNMVWHPILFKLMFGIALDDILVDGKSLGLCGPNGTKKDCLITIDSGTSYMSMPQWAYTEYSKSYPTVSDSVECDTGREFGNLTFVINGEHYSFAPQEWVYPPSPPSAAFPQTELMS